MGHFLNTVEFLDPRDGQTWQKMPISMTAARASLGAASLGGGIYVVGGQAQRNIVETVEVLDVSTGKSPPLASPFFSHLPS